MDTVVPELLDELRLFELAALPPVTLADRFLVPPFSILDRQAGEWQERKRRWLALGIRSELGRAENLWNAPETTVGQMIKDIGATSVFDPALCELLYRWFSRRGDAILDPFAGGSVRGVVASVLERGYTGIDLRPEQVCANYEQLSLCGEPAPYWVVGDSRELDELLCSGDAYDLLLSCPPYADYERYSDDPADLSTMEYSRFLEAYRSIIAASVRRLRSERFAVWVISDIRDKRGHYRGLVGDTIDAFEEAGLPLYNDIILRDPIGSARVRAGTYFVATRKVARVHQHVLVFLKGDAKRATQRLDSADVVEYLYDPEEATG